jgi:hypothetical protein
MLCQTAIQRLKIAMVQASHSYSTGLQRCVQKQLLLDIQARGGISALIKSKKGILTRDILKGRKLYGEANTPPRRSCTTKIRHWKQLYKDGLFGDFLRELLGGDKDNEPDNDLIDGSDGSVESEDDSYDSDNHETPPKKSPNTSTNKRHKSATNQKTPKSSTKPSTKLTPKQSTSHSARKVLFHDSTNKQEMAFQMVEKGSVSSLKKWIGKLGRKTANIHSPSYCCAGHRNCRKAQGELRRSKFCLSSDGNDVHQDRERRPTCEWALNENGCRLRRVFGWGVQDVSCQCKIQWDQQEYDGARKDKGVFHTAMENQDSVQRQQLNQQDHGGYRYYLLHFDHDVDNDIFRDEEDNRELVTELEKKEINVEMTLFQIKRNVTLPGGNTFKTDKTIWRISWIIAFNNERIAPTAQPITSAMASATRWLNDMNGQCN